MKPICSAALALVLFCLTAGAQSPGVSVWGISDIGTATPSEIKGTVPAGSKGETTATRTAKKGLIIELKGKFSYLTVSGSGTSLISVPGIKLTGVSDKGGKSWSSEPIAVGFDSPAGCVEYRFLDSKGTASISQNINGQTARLEIRDGKLSVTTGVPLPLCLAFPASDSPLRKVLAFAGTEVSFENNGARPQPISKFSIFVDEKAMTSRLVHHPEPAYPALARTARIEGSVVLSVTVAQDGSVEDVQVISQSNPLLLTGVVETVRTWQYQPTLLSNVPVEVRTRVTLDFRQ